MNEDWKEFKSAPGVFYRFSASGGLEILGPPESVGSWESLVAELERATYLNEWRSNNAPRQDGEQPDMFAEAQEKKMQKRLSGIPVLKRSDGKVRRSA